MSRSKGARGELEVCKAFRSYGFEVERNQGQEHGMADRFDVKTDVRGVDGLHVQVKRQENLSLPAWITQVLDEAPPDSIPTVVFRRNYPKVPNTWWVALPLEDFLPTFKGSR